MKAQHQKLPILLSGAASIVILCALYFFVFAPPRPEPALPQEIVKSTLSHTSFRDTSLPFAADMRPAKAIPGAYNNETQPSSGIPVTSPPPPGPTDVDVAQPGNQMHFNGKVISVAMALPSADGGGNELAVDIVPEKGTQAKQSNAAPDTKGMTREEELFRAKWGWAMTDQAKGAALEEDASAHP